MPVPGVACFEDHWRLVDTRRALPEQDLNDGERTAVVSRYAQRGNLSFRPVSASLQAPLRRLGSGQRGARSNSRGTSMDHQALGSRKTCSFRSGCLAPTAGSPTHSTRIASQSGSWVEAILAPSRLTTILACWVFSPARKRRHRIAPRSRGGYVSATMKRKSRLLEGSARTGSISGICERDGCEKSLNAKKKTKRFCSAKCRLIAHRLSKRPLPRPNPFAGLSSMPAVLDDPAWKTFSDAMTATILDGLVVEDGSMEKPQAIEAGMKIRTDLQMRVHEAIEEAFYEARNAVKASHRRAAKSLSPAPGMRRRDALDVLMLPADFSQKQLKAKFRFLAGAYHPDRNPGNEESFRRVVQAHNCLRGWCPESSQRPT
jgi:DnaJ domain